jgi:hypothetical protein
MEERGLLVIEKDRVRGSVIVDRRVVRTSVRRVAALGAGHARRLQARVPDPRDVRGRIYPLPDCSPWRSRR